MTETDRNRLASASSPYLRMHADNPVHWQPWDDIALGHARETDTPILLSIGYSACHWCHVMAHECFENPDIAAAMNGAFVSIKLDREERPDIDHVYQLAHQAMSGRGGGWPLTAFLDPADLAPFYIGTYFPPAPGRGLPGFPEVLSRVRAFFDDHRDDLRGQTDALRQWLQQAQATSPTAVDADAVAREAMRRLTARFDPEWGGTLGAPKFPRAAELEWLLDQPDDPDAQKMAHRALAMMAARGLQDHLGGGFFRYCVDAAWTIPHFEKMLYDDAQLLPVYARIAASQTAEQALRDIASSAVRGIAGWLARDMTDPRGALFSALSADSEGEEGSFYLWTREQFGAALPENLHPVAEAAFGLDAEPNFERRAWHLLRAAPIDEVAARCGKPPAAIAEEVEAARQRLFEARERRPHPARDDKVLAAWNAIAIAGFARCARLTGERRYANVATRILAALRESVWFDGELYANAAAPDARIPGFLDDHALLLDALLETLQLEFEPQDLDWAIALADALCDKFADRESGGFWFSTAHHATPLARGRDWTDSNLPNGNAVAIRALLRLGHFVGDTRYIDAATQALRAAGGALQRYPDACPTLLRALAESERPRPQIVIRCPRAQDATWRAALDEGLRTAGLRPGGDPIDAFIVPAELDDLPGLLAERRATGDDGIAYVCEGLTCLAPVRSPAELADTLRELRNR